MAITFVNITNWKELVEQFGYEDKDGYFGAKSLSKQLKNKVIKEMHLDNIELEYAPGKSEGIALFELVRVEDNHIYFTYRGTAC